MEQIIKPATEFIIYGAGDVGKRFAIGLQARGFSVIGVLDQYKEGKDLIPGIRIYRLGFEPTWEKEREEAVIIIALADGMQHKSVADTLFLSRYKHIVFLPMEYCIPDQQKRDMTRLYNKILSYPSEILGEEVICYECYMDNDLDIRNVIIREQKDSLVVWMGIELLFSETVEMWRGDKTKITSKNEIKDKPIIFDDVHENIFSYFGLKSETPTRYFEGCKKEYTSHEKQEIINKREILYRLYQSEYNRGMNFFIEAAPHVMWNERNYFNLDGGHHRTMFLLHSGHTVFPVIVKKKDFERWCNYDTYRKFTAFIKEKKIKKLYAPLPHPGMLNFPVECEIFGEIKLKSIMYFIAHLKVNDMRILDCSGGQAYYARNMERIGVKEAVYIDDSCENIELALLMNKLLYREGVIVRQGNINEILSEAKYDIVFAMDYCSEKLMCLENEILFVLKKLTKKYLIVELWDEKEITFLLSQDGLKMTTMLHKEYRNGKVWSTYAFEVISEF